jgi:tetratricopeptide (TPR) repeat protein
LRHRIHELHTTHRKITSKRIAEVMATMPIDSEEASYVIQIMTHSARANYYSDILIRKDPLDAKVYDDASTLAVTFSQYERALVYLIPQAQLFPDQRGETLRRMSIAYRQQGEKYDEDGDDERSERCDELAEEALEASLAIASSFSAHLSLAEMLIERNERLGEAEDHLRRARALATDAADEAHIEMHLAEIAESRGQFQEAQSHYQRIVDLKPNSAEAWADLGSIHEELEQFEDAERCYMHAIELEPDNTYYYDALSTMYLDENQPEKALASLDAGLKANPDDVNLHASMAAFYARREDYRQAELFLKKAEQLDPEAERVITLRSVLKMITTELPSTRKSIPAGKSTPAGYKMSRPAKHKKRRR